MEGGALQPPISLFHKFHDLPCRELEEDALDAPSRPRPNSFCADSLHSPGLCPYGLYGPRCASRARSRDLGEPHTDRPERLTQHQAGGMEDILHYTQPRLFRCHDKLCRQNLVSHSHASNVFSKRNASYWTARVLALADFGCRWLRQLWRVTEPAAGSREPLWS